MTIIENDPERLIGSAEFRRLFNNISAMTEWRWERTLEDFPKPVRINRRKYYRYADAIAFMNTRAMHGDADAAI